MGRMVALSACLHLCALFVFAAPVERVSSKVIVPGNYKVDLISQEAFQASNKKIKPVQRSKKPVVK